MGQIIINTTAQQDTRIQAAFRAIMNLDHDPTGAEVRSFTVAWLRGTVQDYERRVNMGQFVPTPLDPT